MRIAPDTSSVVAPPRYDVSARWHLVGMGYACACIVVGASFNSLVDVYLETSPFWPSFQSQHTAPWLAAQLRLHLVLGRVWPDLDITAVAIAASDAMGTPPAYARQLVYDDLTSLEAAVAGLRRLESSHLSTLLSAYCWADLQRRWALGHTTRRQARCEATYVANAAVYLEAILRNVADVRSWHDVARFESTIASPIASSFEDGPAWVASVFAPAWAPIEDEANVWRAHGCTTFLLQWANQFQTGVHETIQLRNALGMSEPFVLHALPSASMNMAWTSLYLYAGLYNDFNALAAGNLSLVRTTPTFFGLSQPELIEDFNAGLPLPPLFQVLHDRIGPLGSIDLYWIPLPVAVSEAVAAFRAQTATSSVTSLTLHPTPPRWQDTTLRFLGGNPMCMMGDPLPYVREAFGFDDACASSAPLTITLDPLNSLFGRWMTQAMTPGAACASILDTTNGATCVAFLHSLAPSLRRLPPVHADLDAAVAGLNLSLLQYIDSNRSSLLDLQPLIEQSWAFFGWTMVYDWAMHRREAVSFQGDEGTMHLLSAAYVPRPNANTLATPIAWVHYVNVGNWAFSASLSVVFCVCLCLNCRQQPSAKWWLFPRLVSSVYLNRGLVSLRSLIAIVCLATAPVVPRPAVGATSLVWEPRALATSSILSIEATRVLYCVYDMLHPILGHRTNMRAACSAGAAALTLLVLDQWAPVHVVTQLHRHCDSVNMDAMVYCCSGVVAIGDASRSLVLGLVLLAAVVLGSLLLLSQGSEARCVPSLAVPLPLIAYQDPTLHSSMFLDPTTAAMSGLFRLSPTTVFDTKLWRPLSFPVQAQGVVLPHGATTLPPERCFNELDVSVAWRRGQRTSLLVCGLGFLAASLVGNVLYLQRAETHLDNDYGWATFNSTGARTWLGNLFNEALLSTTSASNVILDAASNGTLGQQYNGSSTVLVWADSMARRELYRHDTPLVDIIVGLRSMDPCLLPWMFTQYCYLDFDGTWEMASTTTRQARCLQQRSNGAVFLESTLRNINDWGVWDRCWGHSFEVAIQRPVATTMQGQAWLQALITRRISVDDEVAYWTSQRVTQFVLQWQNYKTTGLVDALRITSALGLAYELRLSESRGGLHLDTQTSRKMYWSFASDLWAVASNATPMAGASLVRASANFAFLNATSEALVFTNRTLPTPLPSGLHAVRGALGPFNAIDMIYVLCPQALQALYRDATARLTAVLLSNLSAQAAFAAIPVADNTLPVPPGVASLDLLTYGGNLLCGDDLPNYPLAYGLYCFFGSYNMCHAYYNEYIPLTTIELLLALVAAPTDSAVNATALCLDDALASPTCTSMYTSALAFLQVYAPGAVDATDALADVVAIEIELIQFVSTANDSSQIALLRLPLAETAWRIDTWLYLVQWAAGARDVVSFQGDAGTLTTISTVSSPRSMTPDPNEIPNTIAFLFLSAVRYVTVTLIAVACVAAIFALRDNAFVNGLNLFELNRVVGHVWIGRSWLLSRSVSALWLLNTSTLRLVSFGAGTQFESPQLHWATTFLAGGESTWFVYILNDLWSCATRQWTAYYAYKSALVAWVATSLYVTMAPVQYVASIQRSCTYVDMDVGLRCVSASVHIGSATRVGFGFGIGALSVLVCFGIERWRLRNLPPMTLGTTLLNATSLHMLITTKDLLDRPSGVLAGVFALRVRDRLHLFDIKSWRYLALSVDANSRSTSFLIPLNRM